MEKGRAQQLKNGSWLRTVLLILLVLELTAAVLLSTRLMSSGGGQSRRISLTEGGEGTIVTVTGGRHRTVSPRQLKAAPAGLRRMTAEPPTEAPQETPEATTVPTPTATPTGEDSFRVTDQDDTVWETLTDVEIFHVRYDGADEDENPSFTVVSSTDDALIAPGTGSDYSFTLENTGRTPLTYTLILECWMEGDEDFVPVEVRLLDAEGNNLTGEPDAWLPVSELNGVTHEGALRAGQNSEYTFAWQWPFERTATDERGREYLLDAEDTALGNAAVDRDISLHIRIRTIAEIDEEAIIDDPPDTPRAEPDGRAWALVNLICAILTVLLGIYELVVFLRGRKENEKAKDEEYYELEEYEKLRKRRKHKIWDVIPAVGAVVAFILTEDMRLPMTWVDRWTLLMVIILLISITVGILTRLRKLRKELKEVLEEREKAAAEQAAAETAGETAKETVEV